MANCIALFSMGKIDSFPMDVWVQEGHEQTLRNMHEKNVKEMTAFARKTFWAIWRHSSAVSFLLYTLIINEIADEDNTIYLTSEMKL